VLAVAVQSLQRLQQKVTGNDVEIEKSNIIMVGETETERPYWPKLLLNC
jgi:ATP-dependent protease Clp ATPase subunit